jgi:hypothetical protein
MNEINVEKIEKKNTNLAKLVITIVMILICIPILFLIYIMYCLLGTDNVNLENITNDDKSEIINILNLEIDIDNIEFKKIETPKVYKDIYYKLYFSINSENQSSINDIKTDDIEANFSKIKEDTNKIKYCCTIYSVTGKNIEFLEKIRERYWNNK